VRLVALVTSILLAVSAPAFAANVGFEEIKIGNGTESPLTVGIWYPADVPASEHLVGNVTRTVAPGASIAGNSLALVVMSHGGGGRYDSHSDTALALAGAGFVAAAISHAGDTTDDQSKVLQLWRRPAQLRRLVDYMLNEWSNHGHLDPARVGAFGFSNGGFTVLVAVGGVPDLSKTRPYCEANPDHDLCSALTHAAVDTDLGVDVPAGAWIPDPRVKAAVVVAPAFAYAFTPAGLRDVRAPIQLWRAGDDQHQPHPFYEEAVRAALPRAPEYHVVANAGHYDFLAPCSPRLSRMAPGICTSLPGFDRAAFHERFNAEVLRFFQAKLR